MFQSPCCTDLTAQKAHFRQKYEFYMLSETPLNTSWCSPKSFGIPKMKLDFQNINWEFRSLKNRKICTPNLKLHNWICIVFSVSLVTSKIFGKRPWTDVMNDNHAMHFVDFSSHWLTLHNGFKPFLKSMFNFYTYAFVSSHCLYWTLDSKKT